jgi:hypothetical protein
MNIIDYKEVIKLHIKEFGFEPVFTGINFFEDDLFFIEEILKAIENKKPYIEKDVPEDIVI